MQESADPYRVLYENSVDGLLLTAPDGGIFAANPEACRMLQRSEKEICQIGRNGVVDLNDPRLPLALAERARTGRFKGELNLERKDGTIFPAEVSTNVFKTRDGRETTSMIIRDITERKHMETEIKRYSEHLEELVEERTRRLTESESRLKVITDSLPAFISYVDPELKYRFANKTYEEWFGKPPGEIIGRHVRDVVGEATYQRNITRLNAALAGKIQHYDYELQRRSGETRHVSATYVPDFGSDGQVRGVFILTTDVADRKRAEMALRESEEKYRRLFDGAPVSLWEEDFSDVNRYFDELRRRGVHDLDTHLREHPEDIAKCAGMVRVLGVNDATLELYGAKSVEEMLGELRRILSSEPQVQFREELVALGEGKTRFTSEFDNRTMTGEIKHVRVILSVVPGYEKTLGRVLVSVVDLTERRRMEEDLRSARERLEYIIDSNPAAIHVAKPLPDLSDYFATYQSKSTVSVTGFEAEEFIGKKGAAFWARRVHPDDLAAYRRGTAEFWRKGHRVCEYRFLHKDGTYRWIMEESNVIRDSNGTVRDIIGYWTDVTERKRMEEELRSARDRLEHVLRTNPAVLFYEKPLPDFSDTLSTFVSESARFVLGFEPEKFLGTSGLDFWRSHVHPDDLTKFWAELPLLWRNGEYTFEYRFLHGDGKYRWVTEQYRIIKDAEGRISNTVAVAIDSTERKQLEEKLAKSERLAIVGETAAMVGHDLRSPMQGITSATYLLRHDDSSAREERDNLLQLIDDAVDQSNKIVSDLLDYSREIHLTLSEATPKEITRSTLAALKMPANINVQDQTQDQPTLTIDPDRMRRVLVNLLTNAIEAMPNGGTLTVTSKESDGLVELAISDTGGGLAKEILENLWKPLQTTKSKGIGLGLPIVKRIIDAHGGEITVSSRQGEGTTFTIRLPIKATT
jgi:hypothetical protein